MIFWHYSGLSSTFWTCAVYIVRSECSSQLGFLQQFATHFILLSLLFTKIQNCNVGVEMHGTTSHFHMENEIDWLINNVKYLDIIRSLERCKNGQTKFSPQVENKEKKTFCSKKKNKNKLAQAPMFPYFKWLLTF